MKKKHGVLTILEKDKQVLLIKRQNTNFADGLYTLPSGKVNEGEGLCSAAIRETQEEVNVTIDPMDIEKVYINETVEDNLWLHHFYRARTWDGDPKNGEPQKCSELKWVDIGNLPDNTIKFVKTALSKIYDQEKHTTET